MVGILLTCQMNYTNHSIRFQMNYGSGLVEYEGINTSGLLIGTCAVKIQWCVWGLTVYVTLTLTDAGQEGVHAILAGRAATLQTGSLRFRSPCSRISPSLRRSQEKGKSQHGWWRGTTIFCHFLFMLRPWLTTWFVRSLQFLEYTGILKIIIPGLENPWNLVLPRYFPGKSWSFTPTLEWPWILGSEVYNGPC